MSLLREAQEILRQWREDTLAVSIIYRRRVNIIETREACDEALVPPTPPIEGEITATMAQTTVALDDGQTISKSKIVDWLIDVEQFVNLAELAGIPPYEGDEYGPLYPGAVGGRYVLQPMRGDEIDFEGLRYQVADMGTENCWRWHGSLQKTYRVHSRQVSKEQTIGVY